MKNNLVRLIGYIGKHLETSTTEKGNKRLAMRVATHYSTKSETGEKEHHTTWHDVIAWGIMAEYAERTFVKGSKILVEGSIRYLTYLDSTGHVRYITNIQADSLINLDR